MKYLPPNGGAQAAFTSPVLRQSVARCLISPKGGVAGLPHTNLIQNQWVDLNGRGVLEKFL
jgi:hypothetical protein